MSDDNGHNSYAGVEARVLINQHMIECGMRWDKLESRLVLMAGDIKTVSNRLMLIVGGMVAIGKLLDWAPPVIEKILKHG